MVIINRDGRFRIRADKVFEPENSDQTANSESERLPFPRYFGSEFGSGNRQAGDDQSGAGRRGVSVREQLGATRLLGCHSGRAEPMFMRRYYLF